MLRTGVVLFWQNWRDLVYEYIQERFFLFY